MTGDLKRVLFLVLSASVLSGCVYDRIPAFSVCEMRKASEDLTYSDPESSAMLKYRLFRPDATDSVPLVVFLHGGGQRGSDNVRQLNECDVGHVVSYALDYRKAAVLIPQCPSGVEWVDENMVGVLTRLISAVMSDNSLCVNPDRVYIAGFSMGGYGTWKLLLEKPEMFAAAVPVCGGPLSTRPRDIPVVPDATKSVSVWAFNNYDDDVVQNVYSKNVMSALWSGETSDSRYTELREGHSDEYVFSDFAVMRWLFSKRRLTR
jgi:predicted peptidase